MRLFSSIRTTLALLAVLMFATTDMAVADGAAGIRAGVQSSCDDAVKGRKFDDALFDIGLFFPAGFDATSAVCTFKAGNPGSSSQNNGQKGVKGTFTGQVLNASGNAIATVTSAIKTNKEGYDSVEVSPFILPNTAAIWMRVDLRGSKKLNQGKLDCFGSNTGPCQADGTTLCLGDNRFKVDVDWKDFDGSTGPGQVLNRNNNTGSFYFFNPNNQNLVVQLFEACSNNDHFWVFANAQTSVEYDLTVTDTATGFSRVYENELGQAAQAITDTSAFATCP